MIEQNQLDYSALCCQTNFSFLTGASHPDELVRRADQLGYRAIAITDECSLAGVVKAYREAKALDIKLIIGSLFKLSNGCQLVALAPNRQAYTELSGFITLTRRRASKGLYHAHLDDLRFRLQQNLVIWQPTLQELQSKSLVKYFARAFKQRIWLGQPHPLTYQGDISQWLHFAQQTRIPIAACPHVLMHCESRKPLQDTLSAIKLNRPVTELGQTLLANAQNYLHPLNELQQDYAPDVLWQTEHIRQRCHFDLSELRYQYPTELVPSSIRPIDYLRQLVRQGEQQRWPQGTPDNATALIQKELSLIEEMQYEYYFLTVYDIVRFAKQQNILCQGRGSAANSVVCYCLHITEIAPGQINVLFERFISKERDEPPDIDVDFEHQRREEVIQYIYQKYSRERAALAATVITYRSRSAIRDVGKALGVDPSLIEQLAKNLAWWDRAGELKQRIRAAGANPESALLQQFFTLVEQILGFPRHLSQHVGGFIITQDKVSDLVPVENASMVDRTVIQWDKDDIETLGLLKVDVLALGMLTALRKGLHYVHQYHPAIKTLADIPREDPATYAMLCRGDSLGVFQVESRAQMSMLPRLKPQCFYDLVIEIAIVRPGPIQGDMVHPYLRRRDGLESIHYHSPDIEAVLSPTLGVPIFQEQAIRLAMVAAGFSGGEADQLRRAMASWGRSGKLLEFEEKFIGGMLDNGYTIEYAKRLFEQIKGFGGYGFPESHSASFALLCYASSWLKCHHPAAFYCALLNSQPMGFYSPSQLIQDAKRHHINVLPIDINHSDYGCVPAYDCVLSPTSHNHSPPTQIRLGLALIKGFKQDAAARILAARQDRSFENIKDLAERADLTATDLQLLASADALKSLCGDRYQARWQAMGLEQATPLFDTTESTDTLLTSGPSLVDDIHTDHQTQGLSLRVHPMALLRLNPPFNRCKSQAQLLACHHGGFVQVAGLVTGRQRPGTAKGTLFLTLEDETGNINVIVWKRTQTQFRETLLTSKLLLIKGRLETKDSVTHVIAGQIIDYSHLMEDFALPSRDFH